MSAPCVRILLVDDDSVDRLAFLRHVEKELLPYRCRTADSVTAARALIAAESFDVIILDHHLPDGLGLDLLPNIGETPAIFITGSDAPENAVRAMKCGASDYLLKDQDRYYLKLVPVAVERAVHLRIGEEKLREMQELFRQSFSEAPIGKAFISPEGRFLRVNRALCEIFGCTEAEFLARGFPLLFGSAETPDGIGKLFPMLVHSDEPYRAETCCRHSAGHEVWIQLDIAAARDQQGAALTYIAQVQDITARKRADQTRAQLEEQLHQAQKMEALGTLAGGVAHDFNNLLSAIILYTEHCTMVLGDEQRLRKNLGAVLKASERAKEIVQQILTFSRRQELKRELLQLNIVVRDAAKLIRSTIPTTVEMRVQLEPDAPAIFGNSTQIYQALMNLCTNAWHATGERAGCIEIKQTTITLDSSSDDIRCGLPAGQYVLLSVTDNGRGMDATTLSRIFEPFFTTKGHGKGSGLGMAVVHGIMKTHEGCVTVQSKLGEGTTVQLYFPVRSMVEKEKTAVVQPSMRSDYGQRVLFIDDEPALVEVSTLILRHLGCKVTTFGSPNDALAAFLQDPSAFDLVITDMIMPEMTGLELASRFLAVKPSLPIVLITGFAGETIRQQAGALGIREILLKPLTAQVLAEIIHRVSPNP